MKVKLMNERAIVPTVATAYSAGVDLYSPEDVLIPPGFSEVVATGIAVELPPGFFGLLTHRSSLAFKGDTIASLGIIDNDYTGEVKIKLFHLGTTGLQIKRGDRVAQLVVIPYSQVMVEVVDELKQTDRGAGGFGSTGK